MAFLLSVLTSALALVSMVAAVSSPVVVGGDKQGAGTYLRYNAYSNIVIQDQTGAIQGIYGDGVPTGPGSYSITQILAAGVARNDTPLAVTSVGNNMMHIFYLSAQTCPGGNYLYQSSSVIGQAWHDGDLNALRICSSQHSNLLYAIGTYQCTQEASTCPIRVGYMEAGTGYLKEAYEVYANGITWSTTTY